MLLADLGAAVVRIDRLDSNQDPRTRLLIGPAGPLGRGRRSIGIDLRHRAAAGIVLDLAENSDVLLEGFRPGVTERLGFGPAEMLARNRRLVYARMTGWGQQGPLADTAGHDITYLAIAGLLHGIGPATGPPSPPANYVGDFGGGAMSLAVGLLAALLHARQTGTGQIVDVSMTDGAAYLATMVRTLHGHGLWSDQRESNMLDGGAPNYRCYECADGRFVAVGALEPKFWQLLVDTLGLDLGLIGSPQNPDNWPRLTELLTSTFTKRTRDQWSDIFSPLDACVAPVLSLAEAPEHPHNLARGSYLEIAGATVARLPIRFDQTPGPETPAPPALGADTEKILCELGYDERTRHQLREQHAVSPRRSAE
jgi:alpha-methylacyl-CoA racemase